MAIRQAVTEVPPTENLPVEIPGTGITIVPHNGDTSDLVPALDPNYLFRKDYVEEVLYAVRSNENCILVGDAGAGKSTLIEQIASIANIPLRRVNCHGESDTTIFVGRDKPTEVDGKRTLLYQWGVLATAMRDGYWLLLDEIDAALQPVLFVLQQVLEDGGKLMLEDGQGTIVNKHPDFRIFATANTVGIAGQHKLLYSGTVGRMNEATLDRFGCVLHVQPMDAPDEEKVIAGKVPDLDADFIRAIVRIANEVRTQLKDETLSCTFSTRRCIQWARAMVHFHPLRAAKMTVLNKLNADDYKVIDGVVTRYFGNAS